MMAAFTGEKVQERAMLIACKDGLEGRGGSIQEERRMRRDGNDDAEAQRETTGKAKEE